MKKRIISILLCICMMFVLTGCIPSYIDNQYAKDLEYDGEKRMKAFLSSQFDRYELKEVDMQTGMGVDADVGNYATKVIVGEFTVDGGEDTYTICVDMENNQFYWDYTMREFLDCAEGLLKNNYDFGVEFFLQRVNFWQSFTSFNVESTNEDYPTLATQTQVNGMIPVQYNESNMELFAKEVLEQHTTNLFVYYVSNQDNLFDYNVLEQLQEVYPYVTSLDMNRVPSNVVAYWRTYGKMIGGYPIEVTEEYDFVYRGNTSTLSPYYITHSLYTREYYDKMCVSYVSVYDSDDTHYVYDSPVTVDGNIYCIEKRGHGTRIVFTEPTKGNRVKHRYVAEGEKKPRFKSYTLERTENGYYTMKDMSYSGVYSTYSGSEIMFE